MVIEKEIGVSTRNLSRLSRILNYQLSTAVIYVASFFIPILFLAILAAVLFAPDMLLVLFQEKKYGWIIFFIISVLLPLFINMLLFRTSNVYLILLSFPLALFYFYCFLLRFTVNDWILERNAKNERCSNLEGELNAIINKEI
jgi:hypothetical protein